MFVFLQPATQPEIFSRPY